MQILGDQSADVPLVKGAQAVTPDPMQQILNSTWKPTLCTTGIGGMPAIKDAGNVLR